MPKPPPPHPPHPLNLHLHLPLPHLHLNTHPLAIQLRLPDKTIPDNFQISLIDYIVETELGATEEGRDGDVKLCVGEAGVFMVSEGGGREESGERGLEGEGIRERG